MKFANTRNILKAIALIVCLASCDKPEPSDSSSSSKLEANQPTTLNNTTPITVDQRESKSLTRTSQSEQNEAQIAQLLGKAKNPTIPRTGRLAALHKIAETDGDASTNALVELIGFESSEENERRISATGSVASRYPAIEAIKSRGKPAISSMCERLLNLTANGGDSSEIRLICMTALTLESRETIDGLLNYVAQNKGYSASVLDQARLLVDSFAERFPKANK